MIVQRDGAARARCGSRRCENIKYANDTGTKTKQAGFIGVTPTTDTTTSRCRSARCPDEIGSQITLGVRRARQLPEQDRAACGGTVFEGKPRDPSGAVGVVGHRPDRRRDRRQQPGRRCRTRSYALIGLLASVNLLLFFFNLLPLLPLDGGHVAGALVEAAKRGRARASAPAAQAAPAADLRRHRADAAGDVRGGVAC